MCACKTLVRTSISSFESKIRFPTTACKPQSGCSSLVQFRLPPCATTALPRFLCRQRRRHSGSVWSKRGTSRLISHSSGGIVSLATIDYVDEVLCVDSNDAEAFEKLLTANKVDMSRFFKLERKSMWTRTSADADQLKNSYLFPYLDMYKAGDTIITSCDVLEALDPYIMETRKERFVSAVKNRTYSVCLVIEGLNDVGNASAIFRSADALGFQSVHVIAFDCSKRFRENRNVSMGAQKWLDIELWNSTKECFDALKSRGYCIAVTHVGTNAVPIYEMDWSGPTAIVVGNETRSLYGPIYHFIQRLTRNDRGISDEALELADTIFSIPMKGMVESFNVSVASALIMHHALCDRTSRLGYHGDLTLLQQQILLAEFSLRHSSNAISIVHEHTRRKVGLPKL